MKFCLTITLHEDTCSGLITWCCVQNNTGKAADPNNSYYVSGLIHTVMLTGLAPNTTYYYKYVV